MRSKSLNIDKTSSYLTEIHDLALDLEASAQLPEELMNLSEKEIEIAKVLL